MGDRGETIQFRIPADPKYICTIRRAIRSIAASLDFTDDVAEDIELSFAEALTNAVEHGSPQNAGNSVVVVCRITEDKLIIDVRDEGPGFDPPASKDGEIWSEHGRGLRMIHQLMDNVRICRTGKGSRIRMVKEKQSGVPECDVAPQRPRATKMRKPAIHR